MQPSNKPDNSPVTLSVSQLNRQVRLLLESHFDFVWIEGELSNFTRPGSGHWYFSLKDDTAQVRCAMFRNRNQRVRFNPQNGQQVRVRARISLYEGRGEFQLIVEFIEEAGSGALHRAYEELKAKLLAEGLFAPERKRALPAFPRRIGIVSSPTGAALRDVLTVFRRRFPAIELLLFPVPVQGAEAPPAIERAIRLAAGVEDLDALVITRGGGSAEDLWAFNDEAVARAIAASPIPVVSAIGHEIDFTIADFVADQRAPTPSAAAELLSPDQLEVLREVKSLEYTLARDLRKRLHACGERLRALRRQLRHPGERLREQSQRLDDRELRLRRAMQLSLRQLEHRLAVASTRLRGQAPLSRLAALRQKLENLGQRSLKATRRSLQTRGHELSGVSGRLHSLSPLATLERGYAIVSDGTGKLVVSAAAVKPGEELETRLADGRIRSKVLNVDLADD
jgi:exodeoxyribonuclease VII large subunit